MPLPIVHAHARNNGAAARVNRAHGLDGELAEAIAAAADAGEAGDPDDQVPLENCATGRGTEANEHADEVIAGGTSEQQAGARDRTGAERRSMGAGDV